MLTLSAMLLILLLRHMYMIWSSAPYAEKWLVLKNTRETNHFWRNKHSSDEVGWLAGWLGWLVEMQPAGCCCLLDVWIWMGGGLDERRKKKEKEWFQEGHHPSRISNMPRFGWGRKGVQWCFCLMSSLSGIETVTSLAILEKMLIVWYPRITVSYRVK